MRVSVIDLTVGSVAALLVAFGLGLGGGGGGGLTPAAILPDPAITPGVLNPAVTQETIGSTICVPGWTRTVRPPSSYTSALKLEQMRDLGRPGSPSDYQEDHFISLRLGGHPTDPRNLWPRPYPHPPEVERRNRTLYEQVCTGELTLAEAQRKEAELKHNYG